MKVAVVTQRYGADINGGAELHARYIAEHLAPHVSVEVLTTCATDYITWRNDRPQGTETVHGVPVRRFPVARERDPLEFGQRSQQVFTTTHSLNDEVAWLDAEGPTSPALIDFIRGHADDYDFFIFVSFRYYHSYYGARAVPHKAILVPTAERDAALGLGLFPPVLRGVRALMYNSPEERALIRAAAGTEDVPGVVVGVGSEIPAESNAGRFRQKFSFTDRFAIYVGRIDENKGCRELFDFFEHYSGALASGLSLLLIGTPVIPIPGHPRIRHLGFVSDQDKFDAIAAAELLIMPSYFESLSIVALEAWALGKPVLANARCDVLQGQCLRSNGGLFYDGFAEFFETLRAIDNTPSLAAALGRNGRAYFERHYAWPVIEKKYLDMLERLSREPAARPMDAFPGWWVRRRRNLRPAGEVVAGLPKGPARESAIERSGDRAIVDDRRSKIDDADRRLKIGESDRRLTNADRAIEQPAQERRPQEAGEARPPSHRGPRPGRHPQSGHRQSTNRQSESSMAKSPDRQQSPDRQSRNRSIPRPRRRRSNGGR